MASISRSDLVAALAQKADVSKSTADAVLSAFGDFLTEQDATVAATLQELGLA